MKFLLKVTLRRNDLAAEIYHLKEPQKVPVVLAPDEVNRILTMAPSLKARVMLTISYGCGLRAGEVTRLAVGDIDSAQGIIRVVQSERATDGTRVLAAARLDGVKPLLYTNEPAMPLIRINETQHTLVNGL